MTIPSRKMCAANICHCIQKINANTIIKWKDANRYTNSEDFYTRKQNKAPVQPFKSSDIRTCSPWSVHVDVFAFLWLLRTCILTPLAVRTGFAFNFGNKTFLYWGGTAAIMSTSLGCEVSPYFDAVFVFILFLNKNEGNNINWLDIETRNRKRTQNSGITLGFGSSSGKFE